jgi:hypothetical protein
LARQRTLDEVEAQQRQLRDIGRKTPEWTRNVIRSDYQAARPIVHQLAHEKSCCAPDLEDNGFSRIRLESPTECPPRMSPRGKIDGVLSVPRNFFVELRQVFGPARLTGTKVEDRQQTSTDLESAACPDGATAINERPIELQHENLDDISLA